MSNEKALLNNELELWFWDGNGRVLIYIIIQKTVSTSKWKEEIKPNVIYRPARTRHNLCPGI
jgi:hypothetical protein